MLVIKLHRTKKLKEIVANERDANKKNLLKSTIKVIGSDKQYDRFFIVGCIDNMLSITSEVHPVIDIPYSFIDFSKGVDCSGNKFKIKTDFELREEQILEKLKEEYKKVDPNKKLLVYISNSINVLHVLQATSDFINHCKREKEHACSMYQQAISKHLSLCDVFRADLSVPNEEKYRKEMEKPAKD